MKQRGVTIVVGITCLVLGAGVQRAYDTWKGQSARGVPAETAPESAAKEAAPIWTVAAVDRSKVDYTNQPLWAWGVTEPPKPGEPQAVQGAPGAPVNNRFANLTPEELNRKRRAHRSNLEYSLAEIRNIDNPSGGGNVVDWYPDDHPNPMPDVVRHINITAYLSSRPVPTPASSQLLTRR